MERWCETNAIGSLHGRCRVHRAEILRLRGSCNEAETPGAHGLRGAAPLPAARARVAAERARTDPPAQGRHRGRGGSPAGRSSRRVGSPTGSRAGASGPRRRGHRGRLHPRRPRAPLAGALEGATTEHRPAARAAARGAGRDRDRGRRHRPGSIGRRRAGARRRPIREQGVGRRRRPRSRKGAARRRRRGGRGTVLVRSGATLERSRRPVRGGARTHGPRRGPCRQRQRAPGRPWSAKRPARSSTGSQPRRRWPHRHAVEHHDAPTSSRWRASTSFVARATTGR